eukprot:scaffold51864_cov81-Cyclotella_meneghiniana.AAC.2
MICQSRPAKHNNDTEGQRRMILQVTVTVLPMVSLIVVFLTVTDPRSSWQTNTLPLTAIPTYAHETTAHHL